MDSLPNAKELKKLADACRKAGIKSFKGYGIEFTLEEKPMSQKSKKFNNNNGPEVDSIPSDNLTPEELMFWSVTDKPNGEQTT